jgi:threonine dehydrogenase-like Zn-dependent dehydrogenase
VKAVCWTGKKQIEVQTVDDPAILNPRDCIVEVSSTAICGSDLHLYNGYMPTMEKGDILGHEFMGRVVEVGAEVKKLRRGDRVVVPFCISCGQCSQCQRQHWSCCENSNPNATMSETMLGHGVAGLFGYSHLTGGYAGGQARYVRVPFADIGPLKIESDLPDDKVLFLSDIFPTGYMAAENCAIQPGRSVVAIWGCGPVGQFAIRSALLLGAAKVFAIDNVPERLRLAEQAGAITIEDGDDALDRLKALTGGRGPDCCIDAVGLEAHGSAYDKAKQTMKLEQDRPYALRRAMRAVRPGGNLSIAGVYAGFDDKIPLGAVFNKGVTIRMGQTHVQRYMQPLLQLVQDGKIDPSFVITHRLPLSRAPQAYETFCNKEDGCIKVVLDPAA